MNDTPQDYWDNRYRTEDYLFGREPNAFVKSQAHLFKPGLDVLAIADGEGRNGVFVAKQGANVTSVDFSAPALEKALRLAEEHNVAINFEQQDVFKWRGAEAAYDIVLTIFIQFAPPEQRTLLFESIKRLVKPGGLVVIQGYRPEQVALKTGGPPFVELLRTAFAGFEIQHLEEHNDVVDEGPGHSGMSALIDLIARRPGRRLQAISVQ